MPGNVRLVFMVCLMVISSQSRSESRVVADGLAIDLLGTLDLTYQIVPDYDDTESVVAGWDGDEFEYFVAFSKLPPGWLDADAWIAGITRDMRAASERNSLKVLERGSFTSSGGYELSYIRISFILKGEQEPQNQIVCFITDHKNSYMASATATSERGVAKLRSEVISILKTSHSPGSNITPLIRHNEERYFGIWEGSYEGNRKGNVDVSFELRKDLTFSRREVTAGETDAVYTGVWSISENSLNWTYLYGKPTSQGSKYSETDTITTFNGEVLILMSEDKKTELVMQRAE